MTIENKLNSASTRQEVLIVFTEEKKKKLINNNKEAQSLNIKTTYKLHYCYHRNYTYGSNDRTIQAAVAIDSLYNTVTPLVVNPLL